MSNRAAGSTALARRASLVSTYLTVPVMDPVTPMINRVMPALSRLTPLYEPMTPMITGLGTQRASKFRSWHRPASNVFPDTLWFKSSHSSRIFRADGRLAAVVLYAVIRAAHNYSPIDRRCSVSISRKTRTVGWSSTCR